MPTADQSESARILILEDEANASALIENAVSLAGGTIVGPAMNINQALEIIRAQPIDAAILDVLIDGIHCDEVADELALRNIPFAIMTGMGALADHPSLLGVPRISKPFQAEYVQAVLAKLLPPPIGGGPPPT